MNLPDLVMSVSHYVGQLLFYVKSLEYIELIVPISVSLFIVLYLLGKSKGCRWRVAASKRLLKKIRKLNGLQDDARLIAYLRKIDPYLFEELLLTALEDRGLKVIRSLRYSGDGGVDGKFYLNGNLFLVQAKRYNKHIKKDHVEEFVTLVDKDLAVYGGLFVHTGKTGKGAKECIVSSNVQFVSGSVLVSLIKGKGVSILGERI